MEKIKYRDLIMQYLTALEPDQTITTEQVAEYVAERLLLDTAMVKKTVNVNSSTVALTTSIGFAVSTGAISSSLIASKICRYRKFPELTTIGGFRISICIPSGIRFVCRLVAMHLLFGI